jgi:hypothetical protein
MISQEKLDKDMDGLCGLIFHGWGKNKIYHLPTIGLSINISNICIETIF